MYVRRRLDRRSFPAVLLRLAPLILFFSATVVTGILSTFSDSLGPAGDRWRYYRELLMEPAFRETILHTTVVAALSAALSVALGAVAAYIVWRAPSRIRPFLQLYRIPIVLPHLVVAFVVLLFWAPSGIVSSILFRLGITSSMDAFPSLVFDTHGIGTILAYVYKEFPFAALLAYGVLQRVPFRMYETARNLGGGEIRIFATVILPQAAGILHQVFLILFLYAYGGFEIPYLLGASRPQMLSVYVYSTYFLGRWEDRPRAMAALVLLAAGAALFVVLYSRLVGRRSMSERVL